MTALTVAAQAMTADDPKPCTCGGVDRLLDLPEVADRLAIALSGVYQLVDRGEFPARALPGNGGRPRKRVRQSDLQRFIDGLPVVEPRTA